MVFFRHISRYTGVSMDYSRISHLTFDCYGTLIDWEAGILAGIAPVLVRHGALVDEARILSSYARREAEIESGVYLPYREVLRRVMAGIASELGFTPSEAELNILPESVGTWPPFPDTVEALGRLKSRYKLVILSNIDDGMFAESQKLLAVPFDIVITAQQVGSYKPNRRNFTFALERMGVVTERVLHVAQSLYHDHVPAKALGFSTVWINRPSRLPNTRIAPPARVTPDIEMPDLQSLAAAMGL